MLEVGVVPLTQDQIPRYFTCIVCGETDDLTEEEVALLIPFIKSGEFDDIVDKIIGGFCERCTDPSLGTVDKKCSTMEVFFD